MGKHILYSSHLTVVLEYEILDVRTCTNSNTTR